MKEGKKENEIYEMANISENEEIMKESKWNRKIMKKIGKSIEWGKAEEMWYNIENMK